MASKVSSSSSFDDNNNHDSERSNLPLLNIPGSYGIPFFSAIADRWRYIYNGGQYPFYKSRMEKYNSTVYRTNIPPGPFIAKDPRAIVLVDAISFATLFDLSKVDKTDTLIGTYMPSPSFTGGYRVCSYLDPSEPNHTKLKRLFLSLLSSIHHRFLPVSHTSFNKLFDNIEADVFSSKGEADFDTLSHSMAMDLVFRLLFDVNLADTPIKSDGPSLYMKWQIIQLFPTITLGKPFLPPFIEDPLLHTFPYPFFPVKSAYDKFYNVIYNNATSILDEAEKLGLKRDEACHNLFFLACLNAFAGMRALYPILMKWVGLAGEKLHKPLRNEIRSVIKSEGGIITLSALEKMPLTKSTVYEALRIDPPVPKQYGRAKKDFVLKSHDACYEVKKGELMLGFQMLATRDPKIFVNPDEFIGSRFVGEEGEKLIKYVYWSNGPETESPTETNKICAGKDLVVLLSRIMLVEFFLRYDTFAVELVNQPMGLVTVKVKSLTKTTTTTTD